MQKHPKNQENRRKASKKSYRSRELYLLSQIANASRGLPEWKPVFPIPRQVRLSAIAAQGEFDFTVSSLMFFQCVATSATVVANLAYAVRLRRVRIEFVAPSQNTTTTATLEWNAGATGFLVPNTSVSVANTSTTEKVVLDARPPTDTLSGWYQGGTTALTNVIFSCSIPAGGVICFDYDWVPNFTEVSLGNSSVTGASTGTLYCRGINTNILPLGPLNPII